MIDDLDRLREIELEKLNDFKNYEDLPDVISMIYEMMNEHQTVEQSNTEFLNRYLESPPETRAVIDDVTAWISGGWNVPLLLKMCREGLD